MIVVALQPPVVEYDAWKAVYDGRHPGTFGATFARVNRSVDDLHLVTVVAGSESGAAAKGMIDKPRSQSRYGEGRCNGRSSYRDVRRGRVGSVLGVERCGLGSFCEADRTPTGDRTHRLATARHTSESFSLRRPLDATPRAALAVRTLQTPAVLLSRYPQ